MDNKKNIILAVRINKELNKLLIDKAIKDTIKKNKIVKVSDVVREILEKGI